MLATIMSGITLWRTHLAPFRPVFLFDELQMGASWRASGGDTWVSPYWQVNMTIVNSGGQIGQVLGVRIVLHHTKHPAQATEVIPLVNGYDPAKHADIEGHAERVPYVILPKQTVTKTLRFTKRWEFEIDLEGAIFELQILDNVKKGWVTVEEWRSEGKIWWEVFDDGSWLVLSRKSPTGPTYDYLNDVHEYLKAEERERKLPPKEV